MIDDSDLYDHEYFANHYLSYDALRERAYLQESRNIMYRFPRGGKVLDVGCGAGLFLDHFNDDLWVKHAIEPSGFAGRLAGQKDIMVFSSMDEIPLHVHNRYNVIVYRGTLQHISDPIFCLYRSFALLKPGGLLAIVATPDISSLVYRIWKDLPALEKPRNWVLFDQYYLSNILRRVGFNNIEVQHPYWNSPYARPWLDFPKFAISLLFGYRKFAFPGNMMEIYAVKEK